MIGSMEIPLNFPYREVFQKGRPRHEGLDHFLIRHPHMDVGRRAKIFAPFDALRGFDEAIAEKDVLYRYKKELNEEDTAALDRKLRILYDLTMHRSILGQHPVTVSVTYFQPCPDAHTVLYEKEDSIGLYQTLTGICQKVDPYVTHTIQVEEKQISFENILSISIEAEKRHPYVYEIFH